MHTYTYIIYYAYICSHGGSPPCTIIFYGSCYGDPVCLDLGSDLHIVLDIKQNATNKRLFMLTAVKCSGTFIAYGHKYCTDWNYVYISILTVHHCVLFSWLLLLWLMSFHFRFIYTYRSTWILKYITYTMVRNNNFILKILLYFTNIARVDNGWESKRQTLNPLCEDSKVWDLRSSVGHAPIDLDFR